MNTTLHILEWSSWRARPSGWSPKTNTWSSQPESVPKTELVVFDKDLTPIWNKYRYIGIYYLNKFEADIPPVATPPRLWSTAAPGNRYIDHSPTERNKTSQQSGHTCSCPQKRRICLFLWKQLKPNYGLREQQNRFWISRCWTGQFQPFTQVRLKTRHAIKNSNKFNLEKLA